MELGVPGGDPRGEAGEFDDVPIFTQAQALGRSRNGEFTEFVRTCQGDLLRTAWALSGDAHRAEELVQQALVRTYGAWSRARLDPTAYTRRVIVNLRTDSWRRSRREAPVSPERLPERPIVDESSLEDRDRLVRAMATLTTRQRRVVVLRYYLDLSEADVAADLGLSVGTVKSTASRAMTALRRQLGSPNDSLDSRIGDVG